MSISFEKDTWLKGKDTKIDSGIYEFATIIQKDEFRKTCFLLKNFIPIHSLQ
ncbi:MAG: hypothetical protein ABIR03_01925 [Ginsengibacter sp.]